MKNMQEQPLKQQIGSNTPDKATTTWTHTVQLRQNNTHPKTRAQLQKTTTKQTFKPPGFSKNQQCTQLSTQLTTN
jgi:hypothetical protein